MYHLHRLTRCTYEPLPKLSTTIVYTVFTLIALHAAKVWWPGLTRETIREEVRNSCRMQTENIDRELIRGIRAALPTRTTMPLVALQRETGIPPTKNLIKDRCHLTSAQARRLDEHSPLRLRTLESTQAARCKLGMRTSKRCRQPASRFHDSRV